MNNIKFSIGYNFDRGIGLLLESFKDYIGQFYFPIPLKYSGSGRAIKEPQWYENEIKEIIKKCRELGIISNLLINASCDGEKTGSQDYTNNVIKYIKELALQGLDSVTITNPLLIKPIATLIKPNYPNFKIHSSVNCYVKTAEHALYLAELGVDVITIDRDINRDLDTIKDIKKVLLKHDSTTKIKLLLNEGCLRNCPFRKTHFNMISHNIDSGYFDKNACITIYKKHPELVFHVPFIRPEDLHNYLGIADEFKIATRDMQTAKIPLVLGAYANQEWNGDLLFLLSTTRLFDVFNRIDNKILTHENFFENIEKCRKSSNTDCGKCRYCKELLDKACDLVK